MIRTQIQLPDHLHERLKRLADAQEWSMAEAIRRGAELLVRSYPASGADSAWQLPAAVDVGEVLVESDRWRELSNERA